MILPEHFLTTGQVVRNEKIGANDVYLLDIDIFRDCTQFTAGQFVQLQIPTGDVLLRRPLSLADVKGSHIFLIYRVMGRGTGYLAQVLNDTEISVLGSLGNGFTTDSERPLLVGGGLGIAPLLLLAKRFSGRADVLLGAQDKAALSWALPLFQGQVQNTFISTDDGSMGEKGYTADYLPQIMEVADYDAVFTCGPEIMMRAVAKYVEQREKPCYVSLEKRMACGLGACLSCTLETKSGKRQKVCKDGPVFDSREVFFNE